MCPYGHIETNKLITSSSHEAQIMGFHNKAAIDSLLGVWNLVASTDIIKYHMAS